MALYKSSPVSNWIFVNYSFFVYSHELSFRLNARHINILGCVYIKPIHLLFFFSAFVPKVLVIVIEILGLKQCKTVINQRKVKG